jgi:hypothetical protein
MSLFFSSFFFTLFFVGGSLCVCAIDAPTTACPMMAQQPARRGGVVLSRRGTSGEGLPPSAMRYLSRRTAGPRREHVLLPIFIRFFSHSNAHPALPAGRPALPRDRTALARGSGMGLVCRATGDRPRAPSSTGLPFSVPLLLVVSHGPGSPPTAPSPGAPVGREPVPTARAEEKTAGLPLRTAA